MKKKFPCESCVKVTHGGCCNQLPALSASEVAKLIFKYEDIIKEKNLVPRKWDKFNNIYILAPNEPTLKEIDLTDYMCPFLDLENAKCIIYEDRPLLCKVYGEQLGVCPYEGIEEVTEDMKGAIVVTSTKGFDLKNMTSLIAYYQKDKPLKELPPKKALKIITKKEFKHLLVAFNELVDIMRSTDYFKTERVYGFVEKNNGHFSPYEMVLLKESAPFNALQKPYNFLQRKLMVVDYDLLQPIVDKINNVLKSVSDYSDEKLPSTEERVLFSIMYLEYFKDNFKGKAKEYGGLINSEELYNLKKEILKRMGYSSILEAYQSKKIQEIGKTVERVYKGVQQLK